MNILITGFNGFLGKNLYFFLKKKKYTLFGIGRKSRYFKDNYKSIRIKNIANQDVTVKNIKRFKKKFSFIIHCAGSGIVNLPRKKHNLDNLNTTKSILKYVNNYNKDCRVIAISTISIFGNKKKSINSNSKKTPISSYARTKLYAEKVCEYYSKTRNLNIAILRVSSLYGNGIKKQFIYDSLEKLYSNNNVFYGTGNEIRDFIHINDVINLIFQIIKKNFTGLRIINCGSAKGYRIKNILKYIILKTNISINPIFNNKYLKINPMLLKFKNVCNKEFNWKPKVNFLKGLNQYISWYKKNCL
jgi:UDP-glucose 4-epimerase